MQVCVLTHAPLGPNKEQQIGFCTLHPKVNNIFFSSSRTSQQNLVLKGRLQINFPSYCEMLHMKQWNVVFAVALVKTKIKIIHLAGISAINSEPLGRVGKPVCFKINNFSSFMSIASEF